ncbi:protein NRT1/ PTR FAMILY 5.3-like [Phalaenopsis equestris]|uniref:protein NRT1/ PTR FAMILY 5.3-like n=1 Tax=Phalaenopsis equestris TaxID=78828 RepID=UPI0009E1EF50|nr:protein NRT1/ PTR FAMILY 5.3-like [Phalaenopsis equestris]
MADSENAERREENTDYTMDGTVDIKGRPFLRSKGGRWSACSFIVVFEAFERLAYFGVAPNLVVYLTNKLHQGTIKSSNNVTNWFGTIMLTPIFGAYIADSHLGRYWTFVISSAIYLMGMILLTLAVSLPSLRPPACNSSNKEGCEAQASAVQVSIFFLALYIIALGAGGTKPNISTFGADQFDVYDEEERALKLSFFNWWTFALFFGNLLSSTVLIYIQDNVSFSVGYIIPTIALAFSILVFFVGTPFYRHKLPSGSPIIRIARVLVASIRKWKIPYPIDSKELYELDSEHSSKKAYYKINRSNSLRLILIKLVLFIKQGVRM